MRAVVLAATLAELTVVSYADLTVDNVARRAGVHKTTVYRRWKDRESLVADALTDYVAREVPIPDTGTLNGDLSEFARSLVSWLTSPTGNAIFWTLISASRLPEIDEITHHFFENRLRRHEPLVARAITRSELPADTDSAEVIKVLIAPIYLRLMMAEPIDETIAELAVHIALAAAHAGALRRKTPRRARSGPRQTFNAKRDG